MKEQPIIEVENLSKCYRLGQLGAKSLRDELALQWKRLSGQAVIAKEESQFWALKDVSFSIQQGEVVGVIGRNGAGKSTLLKLLSRITEPTSGRAVLRGRVASLLEVGTGFHPELSGRENIFLNGAILGMGRSEVSSKFDEIVEFAGVEQFIDTPVKRYSSGMYVRLAFAIAAHLEPEILIVDEVLAVGDASFQRRCLGKLQEVSKSGRSIIFVSHSMEAIRRICDRVIVLSKGSVVLDSNSTEQAIKKYLANSSEQISSNAEIYTKKQSTKWIELEKIVIGNGKNTKLAFNHQEPITIAFHFVTLKAHENLKFGITVENEMAEILFVSYSTDLSDEDRCKFALSQNQQNVEVIIPAHLLNEGTYKITPNVSIHNVEWIYPKGEDSQSFSISVEGLISDSEYWIKKREGAIAPLLHWHQKSTLDIYK